MNVTTLKIEDAIRCTERSPMNGEVTVLYWRKNIKNIAHASYNKEGKLLSCWISDTHTLDIPNKI